MFSINKPKQDIPKTNAYAQSEENLLKKNILYQTKKKAQMEGHTETQWENIIPHHVSGGVYTGTATTTIIITVLGSSVD